MMENAAEPLLSRRIDTTSISRRSSSEDESSHDGNSSSSPSQYNTRFQKLLIRAQNVNILISVCMLVGMGTIMGSILPKDDKIPSALVQYVSSMIGYTYFLCWSISFYPQVVMNHLRKSTVGLSSDFSVLNVVGFGCYAIYTCSFFFSHEIQNEYQDRFNNQVNSVQSNDVAFAIHALILSSVQFLQILHYNETFTWNMLALGTRLFVLVAAVLCLIFGILVATGQRFQWLDFLYVLSFIKLNITIVKYIPQVILNYQRKSTIGWNVYNVLLDFAGGLLSLVQLIMDAVAMDDFSAITGNFIKFGLGLASMLFDVIFIVQHYVFYPGARHESHRIVTSLSNEEV